MFQIAALSGSFTQADEAVEEGAEKGLWGPIHKTESYVINDVFKYEKDI